MLVELPPVAAFPDMPSVDILPPMAALPDMPSVGVAMFPVAIAPVVSVVVVVVVAAESAAAESAAAVLVVSAFFCPQPATIKLEAASAAPVAISVVRQVLVVIVCSLQEVQPSRRRD